MPPSVGGVEGGDRLLQAVRLRHQPARRRDQEERSEVVLDTSMLAFLAAPLRRQPHPDRHSRLPRRPRRRARRHLRRPLAGADRGARRDDRAAAAALGRRSARAGRLLDQPGVHLHRRVRLLDDPQPARADSAGGDHRHLLRRGVGGGDSGDEQGDVGERAPEGHAGRQHPRGVVAGGRQDGAALRRDRARSTTSSATSSSRSRWITKTAEARGHLDQVLGLPVLRVVRLRRHLVGRRSPACCWCSAT